MVETYGWLINVPYRTALLYATIRFNVRRHVFASRDFKENEKTAITFEPEVVETSGWLQINP